MSQELVNKRSEPRVPIAALHNLSFTLENGQQQAAVGNVSTKGLGLVSAKNLQLQANEVYGGELSIDGNPYKLKFKVIYNNGITIGCLITESDEKFAEAVTNYFQSELQALILKPNEGVYEAQEGQNVSYYEGNNNCYMLLVKKGDQLQRFKLSYFGNVFDGGPQRKLSMGQIVADLALDSFSHGDSQEVLKPLNEVAPEVKTSVLKYLDAMEFLSNDDRGTIKGLIS